LHTLSAFGPGILLDSPPKQNRPAVGAGRGSLRIGSLYDAITARPERPSSWWSSSS
jgi:hypothetical protein